MAEADAALRFHAVLLRPTVSLIEIISETDREAFIAALRRVCDEAVSHGQTVRVYLFEGDRIRLGTDPARSITFPDGSVVPLTPAPDDATDTDVLVGPPALVRP